MQCGNACNTTWRGVDIANSVCVVRNNGLVITTMQTLQTTLQTYNKSMMKLCAATLKMRMQRGFARQQLNFICMLMYGNLNAVTLHPQSHCQLWYVISPNGFQWFIKLLLQSTMPNSTAVQNVHVPHVLGLQHHLWRLCNPFANLAMKPHFKMHRNLDHISNTTQWCCSLARDMHHWIKHGRSMPMPNSQFQTKLMDNELLDILQLIQMTWAIPRLVWSSCECIKNYHGVAHCIHWWLLADVTERYEIGGLHGSCIMYKPWIVIAMHKTMVCTSDMFWQRHPDFTQIGLYIFGLQKYHCIIGLFSSLAI